VNADFRGYLEDRRPNSQGDPYKITSRILQTIATVPTGAVKGAKGNGRLGKREAVTA
jgi:glutamine synthetase